MKTRFTTFDVVCSITELQRLIGMRVNQVYDIDNKTYLIKLQRQEEKCILLIESGIRIHTTAFEWPKNMAPSGFSMKMRKHLSNKRLEVLRQLGIDRIVEMQFGTGEAAYHVFLELYDRGNIILTNYELTILNVLRPHTEGDKIKFAVQEKYPVDRAHLRELPRNIEQWTEIFNKVSTGEQLKKILNINLEYGPAVIDHVLLTVGLKSNMKWGKDFFVGNMHQIVAAIEEAEKLLQDALQSPSKGFIIQKKEIRPTTEEGLDYLLTNLEFHPMLFKQCEELPYKEFIHFDNAVDEFFSNLESQKIDMKALQQEREAMKKLENVRRDHVERLVTLTKTQNIDKQKAELIMRNQSLVDNCILVIQSALASQLPWPDVKTLILEATQQGDPVASAITDLKLDTNHITLLLSDPYANEKCSDADEETLKPMTVDIDLALTTFANAERYYDKKRLAAKKQNKTIESQSKALKSAERKTKQTLKEVQAITTINKARKVYWFEKFFWFISSENYLVIGGRDQQQNELIVKRYLRGPDIYVHADVQGASSVVIKKS
uniref:NFACT RNA-binding domain-containing protein n=1 Tax=Clastoptera arizonana TaxID=38151 RepID=A0A1B6D3Q3_9HEMI